VIKTLKLYDSRMNKELSDDQKRILFEKETEAPFSGKFLKEKRDGSFVCANCEAVLFESKTKFDSGSGWPSFTEPANNAHVNLTTDVSHGMIRTEVSCANCGGHLGHVFDDGPTENGGKRYCINSLSLSFEPNDE
jgi:peptide-methionine (R)-S-oxide reductase